MTATENKNKDSGKSNASVKLPKTITFNYIKGVDFRSVHIDGAIGGVTSKGFLHIALFTERTVIPKQMTFNVNLDGTLGGEITEKHEGKEGVVRQMEVDIIVNEQTAIDLRNWLDERIGDFDKRRHALKAAKATPTKGSH